MINLINTREKQRIAILKIVSLFLISILIIFLIVRNVDSGSKSPEIKANSTIKQIRSSIHELIILPRSTSECGLPYGHATYRGIVDARHGWEITIATLHKCVDCPIGRGCDPGIYSFGAAVLVSGKIIDNQFLTILSAGPGDESEACDGFDNYIVRWEETKQLKQKECGKMYTYAIQYPIKIRITPKNLSASGAINSGEECRIMASCDKQSKSVTININKHDVLRREVVIPFRSKE